MTDATVTEEHINIAESVLVGRTIHGVEIWRAAVKVVSQALANSERDGRHKGIDQADDAVCEVDLDGAEGCAAQAIDEALAAIRALKDKPAEEK